jgi:hypothetical protein
MNPTTTSRAADAGPWAPYAPDDKSPWDLHRVVHLHRRAGFAAAWDEIQRDLKDGPQASVERLLKGQSSMHTPAEFDATANLLGDAAVASNEPGRLKAWWVYRMLFGPDPLGEKLALLWHDHFATSNAKVGDPAAMRKQNELFRKFGRAKFPELLNAAARDPALMNYLDAPANRKGHPNENLARELMELFTLGVGHYSEEDVKQAARALTGWTVEDGAFQDVSARHDDGEKTILGRKGKWKGDDLVKMLLEHPATAERLAFKLCKMLFGEKVVEPAAMKELAEGLRKHDLDVGWAAGTVLRSRAFFAEANLRTRVVSPAEFVVGSARALEMFDPAPSTLALADWSGRLGQDLFEPPNVGGWPGGRAWLSTRSLIGRANYVAALLGGPNAGRPEPFDAAALARRHGQPEDRVGIITFYGRLLLGAEPAGDWRDRVTADDPRQSVARVLTSPEAQLG